jgi:vitamin B12 transporter
VTNLNSSIPVTVPEGTVTETRLSSLLCAFAPLREKKAWFTPRRKGAKAWLLLLALLPTPVMAQAVDCESDDSCIVIADRRREFDTITVTGVGQYHEDIGRAVTTLRDNELELRQTVSIADLLATTPGVTTTRNGGAGGFSAVRIRGAEGEQTLTLIDGVRVNDPSSPGGGFDFGNLLSGNINRIEILRGPNSVPWGSQAIGGVVNIVTAAPSSDFSGNARAEYGYKNAANLVGQVSDTFGPISASLGGGYFRDDGISAFKGGTERDGYRQYAANGKIGVAISDDFDLDFRAYFADSRTRIDGFPPPFFSFADTPEYSTAQELFGYAGANLRLFDDVLKNRIAFTIADINRDNFDAPRQAVPSFLARGRTERFEYQGDAHLSDHLRAVFGAEHETSRFTDGFSPVSTNATSGYAQLIANPIDALTLTGGARVDDHQTYGSKATFSGNAAWRLRSGTIIRAAYGEGFKAPTLFQLYSFFGNSTLNPETARSYEVGIEQQFLDSAATVSITAFQRNSSNQIDFISCFGQTTGICTNRPFGTYDNVKSSRAKGVEASVKLRPSDTLTVEGNYSYIDAKDRTTGLTLLRRPKHGVNLSADWNAWDKVKLGASLQLVSDSADVDFETFSRTALDGYALASIRAAVPIGERFEVYGRIENLADKSYETVSGYGTAGRNAHVGVRAKW